MGHLGTPACPRKRTNSGQSRYVRLVPSADSCTAKKYVHDSITSSAQASSGVGTVSPSALAVLRLITRSYLLAPVGAGHRVLCLSFRYRIVSAINLSARP